MLIKVTVSGADNDVSYQDLLDLSKEYPFVEWGILISESTKERYPSLDWLKGLTKYIENAESANNLKHHLPRFKRPNLSAHLCGKVARDFCKGEWSYFKKLPTYIFNRIQINLSTFVDEIDKDLFIKTLTNDDIFKLFFNLERFNQLILQLKDIKHPLIEEMRQNNLNVVPLYDISGGEGKLPEGWPEPLQIFTGYAGGLNAENIIKNLTILEDLAQEKEIWIDLESGVRTDNKFDLVKVKAFLSICNHFINDAGCTVISKRTLKELHRYLCNGGDFVKAAGLLDELMKLSNIEATKEQIDKNDVILKAFKQL